MNGWTARAERRLVALLLTTCLAVAGASVAQATTKRAGVCAGCLVDPELRARVLAAVEDAGFVDRFDAEVWLSDMSQRLSERVPDRVSRLSLLRVIHREASRVDLPPELVMAVIDVESGFDRWAVSSVGAQGLMQIMPFWLKEIGHSEDSLQEIDTNLRMGCAILRYYLDREHGDLRRALGRYNGDVSGDRYPDKVFNVLRTRWYRR
ncbi:MAG: transglycosylase SLT domain-containing protein [Gammaproteobacteria bacterium]|nr:transglycosylase SLT domain-containing protein [Gammaproteobacteria bacterium]